MFDDDEYDDGYFVQLFEADGLIIVLPFEGIFCHLYIIIQILFIW